MKEEKIQKKVIHKKSVSRATIILTLLTIIITILILSIIQNIEPVSLKFLFLKANISLIVVILLSGFVGFLTGIFTHSAIFNKKFLLIEKKETQDPKKKV